MWSRLAAILVVGYFCWGRSFAYLGFPPLHLFIGEIVLFAFLLFKPPAGTTRWVWAALKHPNIRQYRVAFLVLFCFGVFQVLRGILIGHSAALAIRDLALNYYPLYFFLGAWAGTQHTDFLPKILRTVAWISGIYGVIYIAVLNHIAWHYPGVASEVQPVPLFGLPQFSGVILLGLLCFERSLRRMLVPMILNASVLVGMVIRAEWLGLTLGLIIWAKLTNNLKKLAYGVAVLAAIGAVLYITDFTYEAPEARGGTISVRAIAGRVIAPISPDVAADYTDEAATHEGTAVWRTLFWYAVWSSVHENVSSTLLGLGYGYPLNHFVPDVDDDATRTPHNVFFLELAYGGWIGVLVFSFFQFQLARLLWRVYKMTGQPYGFVFWWAILAFALFTPFFETPYGAIPFYIIVGCACAPLLLSEEKFLSTAGNPINGPRNVPQVQEAVI